MVRDKQLEDMIRKNYVNYFIGRRTSVDKAHEGLKKLIGDSWVIVPISYDQWREQNSQIMVVNVMDD